MLAKRNIVFIFFIIISFALNAFPSYEVSYTKPGSSLQELEFKLGECDFEVIELNGKQYTKLIFEHSVFTKEKGFAQLPFLSATVSIPDDRNIDFTIISGDYNEYQLSEPLIPSRGIIYRNQNPELIPYEIVPASLKDEWYPGKLAEITDPFIIRDMRGVSIYTYPFQYNAARNLLRIYRNLVIRIEENYNPPTNPLHKKDNVIQRELDGLYRSVFLNYDNFRDELTIGEFGDILVICTARDEEAIQPYIDWKREKGFLVQKEVVTAGTNVKDLIQQKYDENNNILYVLLVGDWADIKSDTINYGSPTDPQLGCVAGMDDYPDISIGRFSANNPSDVDVQVNKTINYERIPDVGEDWYTYATGIASSQGPGDDNELDWEHNEVIWNDRLEPYTYDFYTPIYDPAANTSMVADALMAGTSLINYTGHGSMTSWGSSGFSNYNINALTNGNKLPWIVSVACNNGEFQSGECFGEAWLKKDGGGAVAFLGSTIGQPWDPPMRGQDYFMDVHIGGYDYDLHPGQNGINTEELRTFLGTIIFNGLVLMTTESGGSSDWDTAKTWTLFGDPSLQVRSAAPAEVTLSNEVIFSGIEFVTTVYADGYPLPDAMVTISQDGSYFTAISDASGTVNIQHDLLPGNATLVVSGFNADTYYSEIDIVPPEGPYVIYNDFSVNDENEQADYGETVILDLEMRNVGVELAENVEVTINSDDEYVTLIDNFELFGNFDPDQTVLIEEAFSFELAAEVPDGHILMFNLEATDGLQTWESNFTINAHAPLLEFYGYEIDDQEGNNNNKLDPGETADLIISVTNTGTSVAYNLNGILNTQSPYVTLNTYDITYGDIEPDQVLSQSFNVTASPETPAGHSAIFEIDLLADLGVSGEGSFFTIIGQVPVLILDLDLDNSSGDELANSLDILNVGYDHLFEFPDDLNLYASIFVCLGVYSWDGNHVLTSQEGEVLVDFLENGGMIYLEGGDTWCFDIQTLLQPMFHIISVSDGSGDLSTVLGVESTMTEGLAFNYSGDNSFVDHISAGTDAELIFENSVPSYGCGVAYDSGLYKTIGVSFEFGGLDDGLNTKEQLMTCYLDFFGIEYNQVENEENALIPVQTSLLQNYPNPFNPSTKIPYNLKEDSNVSLEIFNTKGQKVATLIDGFQQAGQYTVSWSGQDESGKTVSSGIYFFKIKAGRYTSTKKMILMK